MHTQYTSTTKMPMYYSSFIQTLFIILLLTVSIKTLPIEQEIENLVQIFIHGYDCEMRDGVYRLNNNNTLQSAEILEKLAARYHSDNNTLKEAAAYTGAIYWYNQAGEYAKAGQLSIAAIPVFEQAGDMILKDQGSHMRAVNHYERAGNGYTIADNIPKALELYKKARRVCREFHNPECADSMRLRIDRLLNNTSTIFPR